MALFFGTIDSYTNQLYLTTLDFEGLIGSNFIQIPSQDYYGGLARFMSPTQYIFLQDIGSSQFNLGGVS